MLSNFYIVFSFLVEAFSALALLGLKNLVKGSSIVINIIVVFPKIVSDIGECTGFPTIRFFWLDWWQNIIISTHHIGRHHLHIVHDWTEKYKNSIKYSNFHHPSLKARRVHWWCTLLSGIVLNINWKLLFAVYTAYVIVNAQYRVQCGI